MSEKAVLEQAIPLASADLIVVPPPGSLSVVAPCDMSGGYRFSADNGNGEIHMVRVVRGGVATVSCKSEGGFSCLCDIPMQPEAGVKKGERFNAAILSANTDEKNIPGDNGHNIPTGRWRDGLCSCFDDTGSCFLGYFCGGRLLLGQVLTRNKLNWVASPMSSTNPTTCRVWLGISIGVPLMLVITLFVALATMPPSPSSVSAEFESYSFDTDDTTKLDTTTTDEEVPGAIAVLFFLLLLVCQGFLILNLVATCRARTHLRNRYNIPEETCQGCEDFCCAWCCGPLVICQMARHTADYRRYPSSCCTATGLDPNAPEIV